MAIGWLLLNQTLAIVIVFIIIVIIIIIIIKKGWQFKAGGERLTPYQSEDPSPTITTYRMREENGKTVKDKKGASILAYKKALALLLKPTSPTPSNTDILKRE